MKTKNSEQFAVEPPVVSASTPPKTEIEFKRLAYEVIHSIAITSTKYLDLCCFIRKEGISPRDATRWLIDLGFSRPRASEINRVSQLPDEQFSLLEARQIGWRGALQISRGEAAAISKDTSCPPEIKALALDIAAVLVKEEEEAAAKQSTGHVSSAAYKDAELLVAHLAAINRSAVSILARAAKIHSRNRVWNTGSGFSLTLARVKVKQAAKKITSANLSLPS